MSINAQTLTADCAGGYLSPAGCRFFIRQISAHSIGGGSDITGHPLPPSFDVTMEVSLLDPPKYLVPDSHDPGTPGDTRVFVAVNQPKTTAQILALAVLKGEPCGRELVDCLIEQGIIDIEAEVVRKARAEERMAVAREIEQEPLSRLFDDGGRVWRDAAHFIRRGIQ